MRRVPFEPFPPISQHETYRSRDDSLFSLFVLFFLLVSSFDVKIIFLKHIWRQLEVLGVLPWKHKLFRHWLFKGSVFGSGLELMIKVLPRTSRSFT